MEFDEKCSPKHRKPYTKATRLLTLKQGRPLCVCVCVYARMLVSTSKKQEKTWWEVAMSLMQFVALGCLVPLSTLFTCKIILFSSCSSLLQCPYSSVEIATVIECCWKKSKRKGWGVGKGVDGGRVWRKNEEVKPVFLKGCEHRDVTLAFLAAPDAWPDGAFTYIIYNAKLPQWDIFSLHIT